MSTEAQVVFDSVETDIKDTIQAAPSIDPVQETPAADGKLLSPIIRSVADGIAPNWKITDSECNSVGLATEVYINETWGGLDKIPAWLTLLITVGMVVMPRLNIPLRIKEKPAAQDEKSAIDKDSE